MSPHFLDWYNENVAAAGVDMLAAMADFALAGDVITTGAANNAATASAGGQVDLTANSGTLAVANITTSGGAGTGQNGGNAANINLTTAGGTNDLTVNGTLTALGGTGTSAGTGGTVTLVATGAVSDATTGVVKATDATTITGAASAVLSVVTSVPVVAPSGASSVNANLPEMLSPFLVTFRS